MAAGFLDSFGAIGYAASALLFGGLGLLLLTSWRGRMQGVSDSYTAIRRAGRVPPDQGRWRREFAASLRDWRDLARRSWARPPAPVLQWQSVQAEVRRAWRDGWDFHRAEVARDPTLLAWVLKPHYR